MATVRDIIRSSLRLLGVTQSGEAPTAAEEQDALLAYNAMLNSWALVGVDLEYLSVTNIADDIAYPEDHYDAIRYNLAINIAPEYGKEASAIVVARATETFDALQVQYSSPDTLSVDPALLNWEYR